MDAVALSRHDIKIYRADVLLRAPHRRAGGNVSRQ